MSVELKSQRLSANRALLFQILRNQKPHANTEPSKQPLFGKQDFFPNGRRKRLSLMRLAG